VSGGVAAVLAAALVLGCEPRLSAPAASSARASSAAPSSESVASSRSFAPGAARRGADEAPRLRALEPCVSRGYETCDNALDDDCNGAIDEGCGIPAGVLHFVAAWDGASADVDLNVTDPNGELIEVGRVGASGLSKVRDCPGRERECGGVNLENVFLEGTQAPVRGRYRVGVALESLGGETPPVWVNLSCRLGPRRYAYEVVLFEAEDEQHVELTF
jgi:tRNA (guanosine-2'-O-)-methyltransferase